MITVEVKGDKAVMQRLATFAREAPSALERGLARAGMRLLREVKINLTGPALSHPFWGRLGASGDALGARSGGTRGRLTGGQVVRMGDRVQTAVGSPDRYVAAHETGGSKSAGGGFFRIPTAQAQTASGVDRNLGRSMRGQSGFALIRTRQGRLWIGRSVRRRFEFWYLLVRNIRLRPRHMFERAATRAKPGIESDVRFDFDLTVRKANG